MMPTDFRSTELFREISRFHDAVRRPGAGEISDIAQIDLSPDGRELAFTASVASRAEAEVPTRLGLTALASGRTEVLTDGAHCDKAPKYSPDGRAIAFLSDRAQAGRFALYILDRASGDVQPGPTVAGSIEDLRWSADGTRLLLIVTAPPVDARRESDPSWMPEIDPLAMSEATRGCWICDLATASLRRVGPPTTTVWHAAWLGTDALVILAAERGGEDGWYDARLAVVDLTRGATRPLHDSDAQLGPPVPSPSGRQVAVTAGLCSDRGPVIGDLLLLDTATGNSRKVDTQGVDILNIAWQSEDRLLVAGFQGLRTVVGACDLAASTFREIWSSTSLSITGDCFAALGEADACLLVNEGFADAPLIAVVEGGGRRTIRSFDLGYGAAMAALAGADALSWSAPDGTDIEGWLLRPHGAVPFPLILNIHGGPIGHWRPAFLARKMLHVPALLRRGYAIFLPNPRGSSGRGQAFARQVMGDLGGADARDLLSGLDRLVTDGAADPGRIGVTGVSYGGFMTAWLITQSDRFKAAVAVSPHTNQLTAQLLSNIPGFMARLVGGDIAQPGGLHYDRSPALRVHGRVAPTLNICGALDCCTPPEEAMQFHNALRGVGSASALVTYPREGHGIRGLPAAIDCAARLTGWFCEHIPTSSVRS